MTKTCTAKEISVSNAPAAGVWQAFTRPEMVKQYLFGTEMTADWRVGGAMTYRGQWQGKAYEDKPENYSTVTNELAEAQGRTTLTVTIIPARNPPSTPPRTGRWCWTA